MKPLIYCDLDGVLYDFSQGIVNYILSEFKVQLHVSQMTDYNPIVLCQHLPEEEREKAGRGMIGCIKSPDFYWKMPLLPGAQQAIARLSKEYDVVGLTARPWEIEGIMAVTKRVLQRDFPSMTRVRFTENKARVAHQTHPRPRWVIEDSPTMVASLVKKKLPTYQILRPYTNGMVPVSRFVRVAQDITDVADKICRTEMLEGAA